ncbi:histidine phosphatase family protein [Alicyclobacillus dauci]|uniref:histidine phosphatase family protein n=1 Tax=Alicyclobacillus dauci TaxID=1475485 RepID=UPI003898F4E9
MHEKEAEDFEIPISEPIIDWAPYPHAESWGTMHDRVIGFTEQIKNDDYDTTVIVSHGGPIVAIIHW